MIDGANLAVGLVLLVLVPIVILLIELLRNESRQELLEKRLTAQEHENRELRTDLAEYMGIAADKEPHEFLEADLPNKEEVKL